MKTDAARKQILDEQAKAQQETPQTPTPTTDQSGASSEALVVQTGAGTATGFGGAAPTEETPAEQNNLQHNFFMSASIDNTRIIRDVQKYVEEVISHLIDANGSSVEITLEVKATSEGGFTQPTVRAVSENCRTLKIDYFGFDS